MDGHLQCAMVVGPVGQQRETQVQASRVGEAVGILTEEAVCR